MRIVEIPLQLNISSVIGYYDLLRVYKSATETGAYSLLGTTTLEAGISLYNYVDNSGLDTDWYKYSFYKSSATTAESSQYPIPVFYATVTDLKNALHETGDDIYYTRALSAATDEVRRYCRRNFSQVTETRYFEGPKSNGRYSGQDPKILMIDDVVSVSVIVLDFSNGRTPTNTTTYTLNTDCYLWPQVAPTMNEPYQGLAYIPGATLPSSAGYNENYAGLYWPHGYRAIRITGTWGWPTNPITTSFVPPAVSEACLQIAARIYKGRDNAYSRVVGNQDSGTMQIREKLMSSDVIALLASYRKELEY